MLRLIVMIGNNKWKKHLIFTNEYQNPKNIFFILQIVLHALGVILMYYSILFYQQHIW